MHLLLVCLVSIKASFAENKEGVKEAAVAGSKLLAVRYLAWRILWATIHQVGQPIAAWTRAGSCSPLPAWRLYDAT